MEYIGLCKDFFQKGITPGNKNFRKTEEFSQFKLLAISLIDEFGINEFYQYAIESQYLVNLWTAHILLEFSSPPIGIEEQCLEIVIRYSNSRLNKKIAQEETEWLKSYKDGCPN